MLPVPGEDDNVRRVVELCAERRLCLDDTYFGHNSLHEYTRVANGQDRVEVKSIIDMVLVTKYMLRFVQDVRAMKGMGRGISDHHFVLCNVDGAKRIISGKMREHQYREGYTRSLEGKRVEWDGGNNVKHIWEQFKRQ